MKSKPTNPWTDKKPSLRNRNGEKRDMVLQIRISKAEYRKAKATHGKFIAAMVRLFLCGNAVPEQFGLADPEKRAITHALHAHHLEVDRTRAIAKKLKDPKLDAQLERQEQTFTHLIRVCFSSFSR